MYSSVNISVSSPHKIHVWYICLHLVDFYGKCTVGKYTIHGSCGVRMASKMSHFSSSLSTVLGRSFLSTSRHPTTNSSHLPETFKPRKASSSKPQGFQVLQMVYMLINHRINHPWNPPWFEKTGMPKPNVCWIKLHSTKSFQQRSGQGITFLYGRSFLSGQCPLWSRWTLWESRWWKISKIPRCCSQETKIKLPGPFVSAIFTYPKMTFAKEEGPFIQHGEWKFFQYLYTISNLKNDDLNACTGRCCRGVNPFHFTLNIHDGICVYRIKWILLLLHCLQMSLST